METMRLELAHPCALASAEGEAIERAEDSTDRCRATPLATTQPR
jgi:hypothetical protein